MNIDLTGDNQRLFEYNGRTFTTVIDENDDPWWVAKEVCEELGLENVSKALIELDSRDKSEIKGSKVGNNSSKLRIINESGLYHLIFKSQKLEAKAFKRWVTHEVLPSIRKTGGYGRSGAMDFLRNPANVLKLLAERDENNIALKAHIGIIEPKAAALDRISTADGSLCITDAAKALQLRPTDLFQRLSLQGVI